MATASCEACVGSNKLWCPYRALCLDADSASSACWTGPVLNTADGWTRSCDAKDKFAFAGCPGSPSVTAGQIAALTSTTAPYRANLDCSWLLTGVTPSASSSNATATTDLSLLVNPGNLGTGDVLKVYRAVSGASVNDQVEAGLLYPYRGVPHGAVDIKVRKLTCQLLWCSYWQVPKLSAHTLVARCSAWRVVYDRCRSAADWQRCNPAVLQRRRRFC